MPLDQIDCSRSSRRFRFSRPLFLAAGLLVVFQLFAPVRALAEANVRVEVTPSHGTTDDTFEVRVILDGTNLDAYGTPQFEETDQFDIEDSGVMRHQVYVNGKGSENKVFVFQLTPSSSLKPGRYRIPAITFKAAGKNYDINEPEIDIAPGATGQRAANGSEPASDNGSIDFTQSVDESRPYIGQQILYKTELLSTKQIASGVVSDIPFDGFWHEPLGKPKEEMRQVNQVTVRTYESSEALFASRAGQIVIPARSLTAEIQVPVTRRRNADDWSDMRARGFPDPFDFFDASRLVKKKFTTKPLTLTVLPLPQPPANVPATSYVPVGQLSLSAITDRFDGKAGESISYTVELTGDANLRPVELPAPTGPDLDKFKIYPDQSDIKTFPAADRMNFKKRFPISLIPRAAGTFELPTYTFAYFDPTRGQYKLLYTPHRTISIAPSDNSTPTAVIPDSKSPDNSQQSSDLLPQHTGPETYLPASRPSRAALFFFVLIYPGLVVLAHLFTSARKRLEGNEQLARQKRALENLSRRLSAISENSADAASELFSAIRIFVGDKLGFAGESATAGEILARSQSARLSEPVKAGLNELVKELERTDYGGGIVSPERLAAAKKRAAEIARQIENEVRT